MNRIKAEDGGGTLEALTHQVIGAAMRVHSTLGPGFLESVYQKALTHELQKAGFQVEVEKRLRVFYDGVLVGGFDADLIVEGVVLLELKAVESLHASHGAQLVNYLVATGIDIGLLLNFGAGRLDYKKKFRVRQPTPASSPPVL